ncbi:MAG TPA: SDR family NAD(P)-dependent oxidoreductase [Actinomycetales bacterium]|nr:SDR family NAD(P)-dependent oxidoreductase [Actinomycetales bacterium]
MTVYAIVGAGRQLGVACARRFAAEGFDLALISRNQERVDALAQALAEETGRQVRSYAANVRDHRTVSAALDQAVQDLGPIEVLQYSPLPQKEFLRPVLETTVEDYAAAIEFSVYGAVAACHQVLQGMRVLGRGSMLFVNGGTAYKPRPKFAGTTVAFAAETAYAQMLHEQLAPENIKVRQIIVPGSIEPGHPDKDPATLAEKIWDMHANSEEFRTFATEMDY